MNVLEILLTDTAIFNFSPSASVKYLVFIKISYKDASLAREIPTNINADDIRQRMLIYPRIEDLDEISKSK